MTNTLKAANYSSFSSEEKHALLVVGTRVRDGRACLVLGDLVTLKEDDHDAWKALIPSLEKSAVYWLEPMESVQSVVNLPSNQDDSNAVGGCHQLTCTIAISRAQSLGSDHYTIVFALPCSSWIAYRGILFTRL